MVSCCEEARLSGRGHPRRAGNLSHPDTVLLPQSLASSLLPRRVNLPDALQYVGYRRELLVGQSLNRRDLVGVGALAPNVPHHVLLAGWQAETLKVPCHVGRGSTAASCAAGTPSGRA